MITAVDWEKWNEERQHFQELETLGWDADIAALEKHIQKLIEVAPKDKAGWLNVNALYVVDKLKTQLIQAKTWAGKMP